MMSNDFKIHHEKQSLRLLKLLARSPVKGVKYSQQAEKFCLEFKNRIFRFDAEICRLLVKSGKVKFNSGELVITRSGLLLLKSILYPDPRSAIPGRESRNFQIETGYGTHTAELNITESPLSRLRYRKMKGGNTYLEAEEFQAGEQLRKDFERAQLQPAISANWNSAIGTRNGRKGPGTIDISDFAIDARLRVNKAIDALGPNLAGVTLDICCFLKGIEIVERERCWPPRSAKLMLKTALALLVRHYGFSVKGNDKSIRIQAWGTSDFRPKITP